MHNIAYILYQQFPTGRNIDERRYLLVGIQLEMQVDDYT